MFGEVLKEIRLKNGDGLPKLGEKISIAFSYIDRVEKGQTTVSKKVFEKLLEVYPFDNDKLIEAYCEEVLPDMVKKKLGNFTENNKDLLFDIFLLISKMDTKVKKELILSITEKLEYLSFKEGKYEKIKPFLEEVRKKTNEL